MQLIEPFNASKTILIMALLVVSLSAQLRENEKLIIASGNFAPYFMQDDVIGNGYFDQLVVQVLLMQGYQNLQLVPLNNDAIQRYFNNKVADIAINYTAQPTTQAFTSRYRVRFMNRVTMLPSPWTEKVATLNDLKDLKVGSFIGASDIFGAEYKNIATQVLTHYSEVGNQQALNKQLVTNKIDARVGDYLMLYWHTSTNTQLDPANFIYKDILNYQGSYIVFQDKSVRDSFDEGLTKLIASGELIIATEHWLKAYNLPNIKQQFFTQPDKAQPNSAIEAN
ncbi:substrate-binding periplasmic protein [Pseudoalteromonas ostreae]|nr:ABC transporter substrate-binding protein [Pseudoalteromonas ostreae]